MMTDACSRVSGRTASSANLAKKYWEYINSIVYSKWMTVDAGIDKNTGVVTEDVCDLRDYPTIDELSMNLSNSSMGVAVIFTGREDDICADVEDYSKGEFWSVVGEATDNSNVSLAYSSASENSADMANKLFAGIQSIFSDVCAGTEVISTTTTLPEQSEGSDDFTTVPTGIKTTVPEGSSATTVPEGSSATTVTEGSSATTIPSGIGTTVPEGSEGPSATTVPEGSGDFTTLPTGIKTTVPEGSEGSSATTVTAGSDDLTTVPSGIKTTVSEGPSATTVPEGSGGFTTVPEGSGGFTTVPSGIKTTVPEGSGGLTTVPSGIKTTVPEGSEGPSATTVPEGSDDFTTVSEGSEGPSATTIPDRSDDFTTVPSGIKTTVSEGSSGFTTVPSGIKTTVSEGS